MYKRDQGRVTRIVAFCLMLVIGLYAGYCWHFYWSQTARMLGAAGGFALFLAMAVWGYILAFRGPKSGEFLIELDGELRKVVWPKVIDTNAADGNNKLFSPKLEAWGSTYVVIGCTAILTVIIFLMDTVLGLGIQQLLFHKLLFAAAQ